MKSAVCLIAIFIGALHPSHKPLEPAFLQGHFFRFSRPFRYPDQKITLTCHIVALYVGFIEWVSFKRPNDLRRSGGQCPYECPSVSCSGYPCRRRSGVAPNPSPGSQMNHWCEKMWPPTGGIRAFSAGTVYKHASDTE